MESCLMMAGRFVLASALLMALYWAVWRKQATYRAKRMYLLSLPIVAILISLTQMEVYRPAPVVVVEEVVKATSDGLRVTSDERQATSEELQATGGESFADHSDKENGLPLYGSESEERKLLSPILLFVLAYTFIIIGLCLPFVIDMAQLRRLHNSGQMMWDEASGCRIVTTAEAKAPFSCHRTIYLPQSLTETQRRMILCHELSHIRHLHYRDVWVIEAVTRLLWWNPILWWCRKELRNVHEFEADSDVLATGANIYTYQAILIEEVMHGDVVIANGFNHSFIRRRFIEMLQSSNRRMTSLGKAGTTAWMLLVVGLMCCTVGEAETVYVRKVASDERQATSEELRATSEESQSPNMDFHNPSVDLHNPDADFQSPDEEMTRDSAVDKRVSISIERGKTTVTEGMPDSAFTNFFKGAEKKQTAGQTATQEQRFTEGVRGTTIPLSEYKILAETDTVARRNYALLTECIRKVQDYRKLTVADSNIDLAEIDNRVKAYTTQTFGEAGILLIPGGGYRLPDQTVVLEDGREYGTPSSDSDDEGKKTPSRIIQNGQLPFAPISFHEYVAMGPPFRLIRYADETHLVLYICPMEMQKMINLSWQSVLVNPDTGDHYMLRAIEGFTNDISAIIVNNCKSVPLQMTYIFPPLEQGMKRVRVDIPGHVDQTCRIDEVAISPFKVVRDNSLRARCVRPTNDNRKPENQPPVMERDKSPNYDVQNEHTFPIYTGVQNGQVQVFHRESDHYKIYRGEGCTYVVETHRVRRDWEFFSISSGRMLVDPETGTRYMIAGTEHFPLDTYFWVHGQQGQYIRFVSIFPPLPEQVTSVDLFEGHSLRRSDTAQAKRYRSLSVADSYQTSAVRPKGKVIY